MNIKKQLLEYSDKDFKNFSENIMPDTKEVILGVKIPILRRMAKEIYKKQDWKSFLKKDTNCFEELILQSVIIGLIKKEPDEILEYVKDFIPKINGWGVCDNFCSNLKFAKQNQEVVRNFIQPFFNSEKEYEKRFAFVMLLTYFTDDKYIDYCLKQIDNFKDDRYYAKMAVAWALSICYIKFPQKVLKYLYKSKLDNWTYNKSIQKICESLRVDKKTKNMLKTLKR